MGGVVFGGGDMWNPYIKWRIVRIECRASESRGVWL